MIMELSNYMQGKKTAETFVENGIFGCNFYKKDKHIAKELYPGHSEAYAESAAENYVLGIKKIVQQGSN